MLKLVGGILLALALWETGRGIAHSVRQRRSFSKRKSYSRTLDVAFLLLGSIVGIAAAILLMLVLDHFGLMEEPFIWVSVVPILLVCWFANAARRKAARHLSR